MLQYAKGPGREHARALAIPLFEYAVEHKSYARNPSPPVPEGHVPKEIWITLSQSHGSRGFGVGFSFKTTTHLDCEDGQMGDDE